MCEAETLGTMSLIEISELVNKRAAEIIKKGLARDFPTVERDEKSSVLGDEAGPNHFINSYVSEHSCLIRRFNSGVKSGRLGLVPVSGPAVSI